MWRATAQLRGDSWIGFFSRLGVSGAKECAMSFNDEFAEHDRVATPDEAVREWAYNCGGDACRLNSQWLLHDFDVWVRNPHYTWPAPRHPEDYDYENERGNAPPCDVHSATADGIHEL
jgi:hypothetical protein